MCGHEHREEVIQMTEETKTLSAKQVAHEIGTTGKVLRSFIRSEVRANGGVVGVDTPGSGGTYKFQESEIEEIRARFEAWQNAKSKKSEIKEIEDSGDEE
jgi:hypothetical protein